MSRWAIGMAVLAITVSPGLAMAQDSGAATGQHAPKKVLPRRSMNGPRVGLTMFTGEVATQRDQADLAPLISQFGWQFERQIVSLEGGNQALLEFIGLVGGVESDYPTVSGAVLAGYRLANGFELGFGPNISYTNQTDDITTSAVVAVGATLPFGDISVPLNTAFAFAQGGPRITFMTGWVL